MPWLDHWLDAVPARASKACMGLALALCAVAPLAQWRDAAEPGSARATPEWPTQWEGRPVRPLALSAVEQRFAARFPGAITRLTDGEHVLVLRHVREPTRMLHPATDCYRGLGYRILQSQLEQDAQQRLRRCFVAERDGAQTRVCEHIVDARGQIYTDTSSWFWAAQLGQSAGPWQAVTTAEAL